MTVQSIMIVGVGGQGTLLASKILGQAAMEKGYDVKMSEVHGMAQRGGAVVTYVRYGEKVYAPIVEKKSADIILAFEQLEAYRWVDYAKDHGTMIVNTQKINPMPVIVGAAQYPSDILDKLAQRNVRLLTVDALELAKKAGTVKAVNVVLIGVMAKSSDIEKDVWISCIEKNVPPRFVKMNINAFEFGYAL